MNILVKRLGLYKPVVPLLHNPITLFLPKPGTSHNTSNNRKIHNIIFEKNFYIHTYAWGVKLFIYARRAPGVSQLKLIGFNLLDYLSPRDCSVWKYYIQFDLRLFFYIWFMETFSVFLLDNKLSVNVIGVVRFVVWMCLFCIFDVC